MENTTVLVVDDNEDVLDLLREILTGEGYRVVTARDGREALLVVAAGMPDLILLDMKMPVMNGWEFAREFEALHGKAAPIVVITAAPNPERRAAEIGATGWIGKPFELSNVLDVVATHARRVPPAAAA